MLYADLARLFVGAGLLAFASYTDWRWRRAPNLLWLVMAAAGVLTLGADALADWAAVRAAWPYLLAAPLFAVAMYACWYVGLIAGGADAKALMAIAILVPFPVAAGIFTSPLPGSFAVLGNSLLAFLFVPVALALANGARGHFHPAAMWLGVKVPLERLGKGHQWPMERIADGKRKLLLFPSRLADSELDELVAALREQGASHVWVTPKVPFMIPLLAGFVLAFTAGDLLFGLIDAVVGGAVGA